MDICQYKLYNKIYAPCLLFVNSFLPLTLQSRQGHLLLKYESLNLEFHPTLSHARDSASSALSASISTTAKAGSSTTTLYFFILIMSFLLMSCFSISVFIIAHNTQFVNRFFIFFDKYFFDKFNRIKYICIKHFTKIVCMWIVKCFILSCK